MTDLLPFRAPAERGRRGGAPEPTVVVVGSGKGGVGKSLVSVVLAAAAARTGRRVLLYDADQNLGNLHVLLGVRPKGRLDSVLAGEVRPADLVQPVAEGLWLLPGESGAESLYGLDAHDRARLHVRLADAWRGYDTVIVDSGAGLESAVRAGAMGASRLVVVTMPEPTALTDAYALMKTVHLQLPDLPIDVLVNRTGAETEGRGAYDKLATAAERFLRRGIRYLGSLPEDPALRAAVREPARCLAHLEASAANRFITEAVLHRLDLPEPARSVG